MTNSGDRESDEATRGGSLAVLSTASERVASGLRADDIAARGALEAASLFPGRSVRGQVWMSDGEGGYTVVRASGGRRPVTTRPAQPDVHVRRAAAAGDAVQRRRAGSLRLATPMVHRGETIGFVAVRCADGGEVTRDEVCLVRVPATQAAVTLESACLRASVGVATWPGDAEDEEGLVAAADKALCLAKRLGKKRVEAFR
jgi:GGDEF domain-containing protein